MKIGDKEYTRAQILERVGSINQLAGTRHYILNDGRSKGIAAVDVDTGSGLRFTVLPDRGLDISLAAFKGTSLVYLTPNGEVNPAFYEPQGPGWLRTCFAGLLTTCGLTYFGAPGKDGSDELGRQPYSARDFFIKYQDRILFGVDMPISPEIYRFYFRFLETRDEYFDYPDYIGRWGRSRWKICGLHLPDEVLRKVYRENALRLIRWDSTP
jgi:hypothetical protein